MSTDMRFYVMSGLSFLIFAGILKFVLRKRALPPTLVSVLMIAGIVVVGGMLIGRYGAQLGWPWWIYYTVPLLLTLLLPPIVFSMTRAEAPVYVLLAFASAPTIHILFSFFLGWQEYMPFLRIPSLWELGGR